MPRRLFLSLAVVAVILSACSGASTPALTDPNEILTKALEAAAAAKTVHLVADVSGTLSMDLTGSGQGAPLDLKGTSASADVDVVAKKLKGSLAVPALLGLTGDIIVIGQDSWTKISLMGPRWQHSTTPSGPEAAATDITKTIADMKAALDKLANPPTKVGDEKCGDKDCYHVKLQLASADLGPLASSAPGISGDAAVDIWVDRATNRPLKLVVLASAGAQGSVTVTVTLSNYDAAVTIDPPPADQVDEASPAPSPTP
jgi:outer membrane lipoprotein-sorting protein